MSRFAEPASYRSGIKADFNRLYRATYQRVFATPMVILKNPAAAEDATQDAYLRAFGSWKRWKQDAPTEAWIYRFALNVAFTHRRRKRLHEVGEVIPRLGRPREPDPTQAAQPDLLRELRALPPKQATAVILRHMHGLTNREIAASLGIPERALASHLAAAKKNLRVRLGERIIVEVGTSAPSTVPLEE